MKDLTTRIVLWTAALISGTAVLLDVISFWRH